MVGSRDLVVKKLGVWYCIEYFDKISAKFIFQSHLLLYGVYHLAVLTAVSIRHFDAASGWENLYFISKQSLYEENGNYKNISFGPVKSGNSVLQIVLPLIRCFAEISVKKRREKINCYSVNIEYEKQIFPFNEI